MRMCHVIHMNDLCRTRSSFAYPCVVGTNMCVVICIHIHTCMVVYICNVYIYIYIFIHIYIYLCMYTCSYLNTYIHTYMYLHICVYINIYAHIYNYIYDIYI